MTRRSTLSPRERVSILLEEYRVLYGLVEFRMASLDRRVPVAGATVTAFLGSIPFVSTAVAIIVLVVVPLSLVWLIRTTINHARSFEDALRRVEAIESRVNTLAGEDLLRFQSTHPSRGRAIGGRTGDETVRAVMLASGALLSGCVLLAYDAEIPLALAYAAYVALIACYLLVLFVRRRRYRYDASR